MTRPEDLIARAALEAAAHSPAERAALRNILGRIPPAPTVAANAKSDADELQRPKP